jgi:hypothetical protein
MELLLNLCWLMLALPAYWLWRREADSARSGGRSTSLGRVLVLGCILVLLFPVVSATDDLHVMRPEMEESTRSKRTLKHASNAKSCVWLSGPITQPANTVVGAVSVPVESRGFLVLIPTTTPSPAIIVGPTANRAPPVTLLG